MSIFEQMTERKHERICFHYDAETDLRAIVAIHSTALGNALGGTRRWHYATEADAVHDVLRLSEGMTYKAAAADLPMGGGKSVILLPTPGFPMTEARARAMGRFVDTFNGAYIAAEDVGVNTQFVDWMALETKHVMGGETIAVGGDPSPYTAQGVVNAMRACLASLGRPPEFAGVSVAIQGVGSVGRNIARLLTEAGAKLFVADINEEGVEQVVDEFGATGVSPNEILLTACDILAPCALGGVIDASIARKLKCKIVCGAANNILDDPDEDAAVLQSAGILYAPDFVANAGGLIRLAGLYLGMKEQEIERKIAKIEHTIQQILADTMKHSSTHAAAIAYANAKITSGSKMKAPPPTAKVPT
jgi:leucine dehydrogenase